MAVPDLRRRTCQICGKDDDEAGPISWRGKCAECAIALVAENMAGIREKQGPAFQRWRLGTVAAVLPSELLGVMFSAGIFAEPEQHE